MAKVVSGILTLYFLGMAFLPCADSYGQPASGETPNIYAGADHSSHEHQKGKDLCSPLCFCHCCHTHVSFPDLSVSLDEIEVPATQVTSYKDFIGILPLDGLLRPPQA